MRGFINAYTIGALHRFVKFALGIVVVRCGVYRRRENGYNEGSLSAEVAELADA